MAYLLSKLLPLALLPLGLSLILLLIGLIGRWRWPVITALLLLWVLSLGVVSQGLWRWLEAPWQRRAVTAAPRRCDRGAQRRPPPRPRDGPGERVA